jgi:glutaryl-CoA dehydrogenase
MSEVDDSPFSDFLGFELLLEEQDLELLSRVRAWATREVEPVINEHWTRGTFPHDLVPGLAGLGIAGLAYDGPGCPARGALVDGMVAMELARVDPSIATFMGVHGGLAMGSIHVGGSPEQH